MRSPPEHSAWVGLAIACQHPSLGGVEQPRTMVFATAQNPSGSPFLGPGSPLCHGVIHMPHGDSFVGHVVAL